jgi:ABC-type multidrug transport system fused ATPase/permease subunit
MLLAAAHWVTRLGSRFATISAAQRVEADLRERLYAALQRFPPEFFAQHSTGDLMTRASSDVSAVRSLVGFGAITLTQTLLAFGGALAAMVAVDPWLTAWAMAPVPVVILLARRFNVALNARTQAMQEQLGVLSGRVQEAATSRPDASRSATSSHSTVISAISRGRRWRWGSRCRRCVVASRRWSGSRRSWTEHRPRRVRRTPSPARRRSRSHI